MYGVWFFKILTIMVLGLLLSKNVFAGDKQIALKNCADKRWNSYFIIEGQRLEREGEDPDQNPYMKFLPEEFMKEARLKFKKRKAERNKYWSNFQKKTLRDKMKDLDYENKYTECVAEFKNNSEVFIAKFK